MCNTESVYMWFSTLVISKIENFRVAKHSYRLLLVTINYGHVHDGIFYMYILTFRKENI